MIPVLDTPKTNAVLLLTPSIHLILLTMPSATSARVWVQTVIFRGPPCSPALMGNRGCWPELAFRLFTKCLKPVTTQNQPGLRLLSTSWQLNDWDRACFVREGRRERKEKRDISVLARLDARFDLLRTRRARDFIRSAYHHPLLSSLSFTPRLYPSPRQLGYLTVVYYVKCWDTGVNGDFFIASIDSSAGGSP